MKKRLLSLTLVITLILSIVTVSPIHMSYAGGTTLIIHYQRDDNNYDDWNLWVWADGSEGKVYEFEHEDDFGKVAVIQYPSSANKFGFIVRTDDWDKDVEADRFIEVNDGFAEIWVNTGQEVFSYQPPEGYEPYMLGGEKGQEDKQSDTSGQESIPVRVHYHRHDNNYEGWNLWLWPDEKDGDAYYFTDEDDFGKVAEVEVLNTSGVSKLGIIVRLNEWEAKDVEQDRFIPLSKLNDDGVLQIYIIQGDEKLYYSKDKIDLSPKFLSASLLEPDRMEIEVTIPFELTGSKETFKIVAEDGSMIDIKEVIPINESNNYVNKAELVASKPLGLGKNYRLAKEGYGDINVALTNLFDSEAFEEMFYYQGEDLGAVYTNDSTVFKVWAPTASQVQLVFYEDGYKGKQTDSMPMEALENGIWTIEVKGNLHGQFYNYEVKMGDKTNEAVDPYAKAVGVNGHRSMVVNLDTTNPEGWENDKKPEFKSFTDAIIYELHIRDLSTHESSGITNKGKFLGLTETGTTNKDGLATGLDHLKELGITHLHLLPSFDFKSINETTLDKNNFNWGYDPQNYNVPEGSYSTDPYSGTKRIEEFKEMVQTLHENDIRVVMDVVYNHTGASADSHFNKIVPSYYYRTVNGKFSNGSGCGNEIASERAMVRKMIVESVAYWATEYHIDGFRFDLMGLHDIETMNEIRARLDEIDPSILVYGEGWTGGSTPLKDAESALKKNTFYLNGIAAFSDDMRDGIKGHVFTANKPGFANGLDGMEESVKFGIVASTEHNQVNYNEVNYSDYPWADAPSQAINYVSAHDNLTLWDKLEKTNPKDSVEEKIKMDKLSNAIVLTSQGIPFLHAGVEMLRTKGGNENSYKSPDSINQINWNLKTENNDVYKYYQGLIAFRKAHPALRMTSTEDIQKNLAFFGKGNLYFDLQLPADNMVGYLISNHANGDTLGSLCVLFNANQEAKEVTIPEGQWHVYINGEAAGTEIIETIEGDKVIVDGRSALVLGRDDVVDISHITGYAMEIDTMETNDAKNINESANDKESNGKSAGLIIGILLAVVLLIGISFVYIRRNRNR